MEQIESDVSTYDVPELRGKDGTAFMDGLERHLKYAESTHVKEQAYEQRRQETLMEKQIMTGGGIKGIEGLGQLKSTIPAREFFRWRQAEGDDCWTDEHFRKSFFRDNPEYVVKDYQKSFI